MILDDNFDPLWAALGIKRKEWAKPAPQPAKEQPCK